MGPVWVRAGRTWPPTKPAFSLGMFVWVSASVVRLALLSSSWLLKSFSSCQGRSLCLGSQEGPRGQSGHLDLGFWFLGHSCPLFLPASQTQD